MPPVDILWTSLFIDMAADCFDAGVAFWSKALGYEMSALRGDRDEFATLIPPDGDPYLRVQRTADGTSGIHLDLHVSSPQASAATAEALGAELVADVGYVVMRSPTGLAFCFVKHHGEARVPSPLGTPPNRADQLCIDIAPDDYERECIFWADLTGWEPAQSGLSEFRSLRRPTGQPVRFLLQRLDDPLAENQPHAHLDIACGEHMADVAPQHIALGAKSHGATKVWIPMSDPSGLSYCLTPRRVSEP